MLTVRLDIYIVGENIWINNVPQ